VLALAGFVLGTRVPDQHDINDVYNHLRGVTFMIGIPDEPTDEDIRRILLFLEWVSYPAMLAVKLTWVDQIHRS
jgi:hypothetical protein